MKAASFRRTAIPLAALLASLLVSGCFGVAVRGIHMTVDRAQPVLRDSAVFYAGGIQATAVLVPVKKGRSAALLISDEAGGGMPLPGSDAASPNARMVLWTFLTNRSGVTAEIDVASETCALGTIKDKVVALAPGQRVMLDPLWSAQDQNLENLEVTLTLKLRGIAEENKLMLAQMRKP